MRDVNDEGSEVQFWRRLEKSYSFRDRILDFLVHCDLLVRIAIFVVAAGIIVGLGLLHNFVIWFFGGTRRIT